MVNSLCGILSVWYIISAVAAGSLSGFREQEERSKRRGARGEEQEEKSKRRGARGEQEERREQAPKDLWLLEWLVACVDGSIDTRG